MTFAEIANNSIPSDSGATRASLISRVRVRDPRAWHELVELYGPLIAHWCYRLELDAHTAADCVQEVFAAVLRALPAYRSQDRNGAFRSWLWTITRNKVRDQMRRKRSQVEPQGGTSAMERLREIPVVDETVGEEPSSEVELKRLVSRALEQIRGEFEPRSMNIFTRSVIDQIETAIVASEFNIQTAAVRQIRSRILRRLRQQLGDFDG